MNICDIKYEGNVPNNKHIIVCCSIFRLKNMYTDMTKYYNGLKLLIDTIKNHNKYFLRIHYDFSVSDDDTFINIKNNGLKYDNIQFCKYYCEKFIDKNTKLHFGIFGTFIRFLPFFDNNLKNNLRILVDIDFSLIELYMYLKNNVDKLLKSKYDCLLINYFGYGYRYGNNFNNEIINETFIAHIYLRNISLNIKILENILNDLLSKKDYIYNDIINMVKKRKILNDEKYNKIINNDDIDSIDNLFIYGMDEWFLNKILVNEIVKNTKKIGFMQYMDRIYLYSRDMFNWNLINSNSNYKNILIKNTNIKSSENITQDINNYVSFKNIQSYDDIKKFYKRLNIFYKNSKQLYKINSNTIYGNVWIDNLKKNLKLYIDIRLLYNLDYEIKKRILRKYSKIKSLI